VSATCRTATRAAVFLTKQSGLAEGVAVLAALAVGPRRRSARDGGLAWLAAATYAAVLGISTLELGLASHGSPGGAASPRTRGIPPG
jgi:hypothetical protein